MPISVEINVILTAHKKITSLQFQGETKGSQWRLCKKLASVAPTCLGTEIHLFKISLIASNKIPHTPTPASWSAAEEASWNPVTAHTAETPLSPNTCPC
jgi:hypothetical protein